MFWWERWESRLQQEYDAFEKAGYPFVVNEAAKAEGYLKISIEIENPLLKGEKINLEIIYPDLFPYFKFEIFAHYLDLKRHQNPFEKHLCLYASPTAEWFAGTTAAEAIQERLPKLLKSVEDPNQPEFPQGEPFSNYYPYLKNCNIISDIFDFEVQNEKGKFKYKFPTRYDANSGILALLTEIKDGKTTKKSKLRRSNFFGDQESIIANGIWLKFSEPPQSCIPRVIFKKFLKDPRINETEKKELTKSGKRKMVGFLFTEEGTHRGKNNGWLFILKEQDGRCKFIRADRGNLIDLQTRVPETAFLREKTVALAGVGCLGSVIAIELAKAGVGKLKILDHDFIHAGNSVRWPLGFGVAGMTKVEALKQFIETQWPYTEVVIEDKRIGGVLKGHGENQIKTISRFTSDADIIVDATAEVGINYFLSDIALEEKLPYCWVEARAGIYGGICGRVIPGQTQGCWSCFSNHVFSETNPTKGFERPNCKEEGEIQPTSCGEPTFTGSGFETSIIALQAVRLTIATLGMNHEGAFPNFDWDVQIINLRKPTGEPISPDFKTQKLTKHPDCKRCGP